MHENVIIPRPEAFPQVKQKIAETGAQHLYVLSDFDRTLTKAFVYGKEVPSLISVLRDGQYLTPDYARKAQALFDKYHPLEINPHILLAEKKKAMQEWWTAHFDLLIQSGLHKKDIESAVTSGNVVFRPGAPEAIDFLHQHNIPLIILSSSGLGGDAISIFLKKEQRLYDNIYIISNFYEWDKQGNARGVKKPIIHVLNKDETALRDFPFYTVIKNRRNIILLGDSIGDLGMLTGAEYDNVIKIGFLNNDVANQLDHYKHHFDMIIINDSDMTCVNELLKEIVNGQKKHILEGKKW